MVSFCTPIYFNNKTDYSQWAMEIVDDYFFLGGKRAQVLKEDKVLHSTSYLPWYIVALKVVSYFTIILPAIAFAAKCILRKDAKFTLIDLKASLGSGISISTDVARKVEEAVNSKSFKRLTGRNTVFKLDEAPGFIFKISRDSQQRFNNMMEAERIKLVHQLGLLVIPRAMLFEIEIEGVKTTVIAEEDLQVSPHEKVQEQIYANHASDLNEAIRQLAKFIILTGLDDVEARNNPAIKDSSGKYTHIALLDLEKYGQASRGIFGGLSTGLLNHVFSEENIETVVSEAAKAGYRPVFDEVTHRKAKIKEYKEMCAFHKERDLDQDPKRPIQVADINSLGLDLDEKDTAKFSEIVDDKLVCIEREVTLREVLLEVIKEINQQIQASPEDETVHGQRSVLLDLHTPPFRMYQNLGLKGQGNSKVWKEEELDQVLFVRKIFQALHKNGYIFKSYGDAKVQA